jgi:hypothetical protein
MSFRRCHLRAAECAPCNDVGGDVVFNSANNISEGGVDRRQPDGGVAFA